MSPRYEIVAGSVLHVKPLVRSMRPASYAATQAYGYEPRQALRRVMQQSHYCRTALIKGRPVAMWGASGPLLADRANVWLVISDDLRHMPIAIMREARRELALVASRYEELSATLLPGDATSVRFAIRLGFCGKDMDGDEDAIMADVFDNPAYRVPLGDAYAIELVWLGGED